MQIRNVTWDEMKSEFAMKAIVKMRWKETACECEITSSAVDVIHGRVCAVCIIVKIALTAIRQNKRLPSTHTARKTLCKASSSTNCTSKIIY